MPSCQGSLRAPGSSQARVHGCSSISTLYPFASGQQAASRPEPLFTGIFTMTLTSGLHGPQLPGSVARDSWSTQTPTCFGLPGVSPSVRLISLSSWEHRREGPPSEPSTAGRVVGGPVWGMAITLTQSTRDIYLCPWCPFPVRPLPVAEKEPLTFAETPIGSGDVFMIEKHSTCVRLHNILTIPASPCRGGQGCR